VNLLRQLFPGIGFANEKIAEAPLPQHAEGWFAIPKWQSLGTTYLEAFERVLDKFTEICPDGYFCNNREGELQADRFRQNEWTMAAFDKLAAEQKGFDILVVPAQFGLRHRGRSVLRTRAVLEENEFPLDAFAVAIMILLHPERLGPCEEKEHILAVECPGNDNGPDIDNVCPLAPYFCVGDDGLNFGIGLIDDPYADFGSASGFI